MSKASTAKSDVREDALQAEKLQDCLDVLVASGYYHAGMGGSDNFDKIVGGIVWCLAKLHFSTNRDFEFYEEATIKERIYIAEVIAESLIAMSCPFDIEPHQIHGLDYIHLFPVVQWLISKSMQFDVNVDRMNYFSDWFGKYDEARVNREDYIEEARTDFLERLRGVYDFEDDSTVRDKKRIEGSKILDLGEDVKCTIAEYIKKSKDGGTLYTLKKVETETENSDGQSSGNLEESSAKPRVSTKIVREMIENAISDVYKDESKTDRAVRLKMEKAMEEFELQSNMQKMEDLIEADAMEYLQARAENDSSIDEEEELSIKFRRASECREIKQLSELVEKCTEAKKRSNELRDSTKKELELLKSQIMAARMNVDSATGKTRSYDPKLREAMDQLEESRVKRANTAREVVFLQQRLDKSLTETLKTQYYAKEIERANDIQALNNEMKRLLLDHNTAIDILNFSTKVLSFTNKIEETILDEKMSDKYRDAFINYMNDVRAQLAEYHWKGKLTQERMLEEKRALGLRHKELQRSKRITDDASDYLKNMVIINHKLNQYTATLDRLEKSANRG